MRSARDICAALAAAAAPELAERLGGPHRRPAAAGDEQLRLAAAITARTLERLD